MFCPKCGEEMVEKGHWVKKTHTLDDVMVTKYLECVIGKHFWEVTRYQKHGLASIEPLKKWQFNDYKKEFCLERSGV